MSPIATKVAHFVRQWLYVPEKQGILAHDESISGGGFILVGGRGDQLEHPMYAARMRRL
jgi:hypothetical protein